MSFTIFLNLWKLFVVKLSSAFFQSSNACIYKFYENYIKLCVLFVALVCIGNRCRILLSVQKQCPMWLVIKTQKYRVWGKYILFCWTYLRYLCLLAYNDVKHILCCVFVLLVYHMLPASLDCPFVIVPLVLFNVYFECWIDHLYISRMGWVGLWCLTSLLTLLQLYRCTFPPWF
jgi:hypothetical protein